MPEPFIDDIKRSGRVDLPPQPDEEEKETPPAPSAEEETKEETPPASPGGDEPESKEDDEGASEDDEGKSKTGDEDKLPPFHKHPKWISVQQDLKELREFKETALPLLENIGKAPSSEEKDEIPEWFSDLFGENESAWKKYRAYNAAERKQLREEITTELQQAEARKVDDQKRHDQWVDDEVQKLKDEGLKFDQNELLRTALEYLPTDANGNISFKKAYDIMVGMKASGGGKPKSAEEKKKIADATMGKDKGSDGKRDYKIPADLKGKTFHDLANPET